MHLTLIQAAAVLGLAAFVLAFVAHIWRLPLGLRFRPDWGSDLGGMTLTAADAVLKEDYHGPVREQLNNANVILANVEQNEEDIIGRRAVLALHTGRNSGVGARPENGTLPTAGNQKYEDVFIPTRNNYARITLTGPVIAAMAKDAGSFIRALSSEMDGARTDANRDMCRQVWGTSNGAIALCGATAAANVVVLDAGTFDSTLYQLEEGFQVDIGTVANPTLVASGRNVTAVDHVNKTITIDGAAVTTSNADSVFRAGAGGASNNSGKTTDGQIELTGLQTIVDDTAVLHTLDPAVESKWKAQVYANGGVSRNISENLVITAIMKADRIAGAVPNLLVGSDGVFRSYGNLLSTLRRVVDSVNLKGGYTGLSISTAKMGTQGNRDLALTWDRDAPNTRLYGVSTADLNFYQLTDWEWMDQDGSVLRRVTNTDAYEATLKKYGDIGCSRRNSQFVIKDIAES